MQYTIQRKFKPITLNPVLIYNKPQNTSCNHLPTPFPSSLLTNPPNFITPHKYFFGPPAFLLLYTKYTTANTT